MKKEFSEKEKEEIVSIYLCNKISANNIGYILKTDERTILKILREFGFGKNLEETQMNLKRAAELYKLGTICLSRICKECKVSRNELLSFIQKNKIQSNLKFSFLTEEDLEESISIYLNNNISTKHIAKMYGVSLSYFESIINFLGIKKDASNYSRKIPAYKHLEIIREYEKSKSVSYVAKKHNVSMSCIHKILNKNNVRVLTKKDKRILNDEQEKEALFRYKNGESLTSIARSFNITQPGLSRYFDRNNVKTCRKTGLEHISKQDEKDIVTMYMDFTVFVKDIKLKFNISTRALIKIIEKNKLPKRTFKNTYSTGISGFYLGYYFRSLNELCFMGKELTRSLKKEEWRSGENKNDRIRYINNEGKEKWYYPDFIIKDRLVIEVKPSHLFCDANVKCKNRAAEDFCKKNNKKFMIIDYPIDVNFIVNQLKFGNVKMSKRNFNRLRKKYLNKDHLLSVEESGLNLF